MAWQISQWLTMPHEALDQLEDYLAKHGNPIVSYVNRVPQTKKAIKAEELESLAIKAATGQLGSPPKPKTKKKKTTRKRASSKGNKKEK